MKRKPVVCQLVDMKNKEITTRCGRSGVLVRWSAWPSDTTCFDCLSATAELLSHE